MSVNCLKRVGNELPEIVIKILKQKLDFLFIFELIFFLFDWKGFLCNLKPQGIKEI